MAGYSTTPLIKKLGIKKGARIIFINEPASLFLELGVLPKGVKSEQKLSGGYDYIHYFAFSKTELATFFQIIKKHLKKDGMLWISWIGPSKNGGDLNENIVREIGLKNGLVDVKVAAIDDTWSGLKFVYRLKDR